MDKPKVIAVVGPTASGKTSLAITLAKQFDGEVISADSRQVYRGLDIGTGKVTSEETDGVPHHLIDIIEPTETYTAADFKRDATVAIENIHARGRLPIIAGGTFFYLELLRSNMTPAPVQPNPELRQSLERFTNAELLARLRVTDQRRAESIDPQNRRRIIRALEIVAALGAVPPQPPSDSPYQWLILGIHREKSELRARFHDRIKTWIAQGFLKEVDELQSAGITSARFAEFGFEYTLGLTHLTGELTEAELMKRFVERNWQYAKRQLAWLKRDKEIMWIDPTDRTAVYATVRNFFAA